MRSRAPRYATIALAGLTLASTSLLARPPLRAQQAPTSPNVVLIVVDDMRWDESGMPTALNERFPKQYLPTIRNDIAADGFYASNAFVVNSLCCPSRASILTGNYSHTTGVWNNQSQLGRGGFEALKPKEGSTLATWFDDGGYRTALVGKYVNGYNATTHRPKGWDRWVAFIASTVGHYNYKLTIDGVSRSYGSTADEYSTDVLADHASDFIRSTPAETPLFLYFTPYAPHSPFKPAPRHEGMFASYVPAMPPNLAEADVSDKPGWVRSLRRAGSAWAATKRTQMEMLMSVDDAIAQMQVALGETGRLDNTIFVLISDNGLSGGSHRWTAKKSAWDEALRVPFIAKGPGITPGTTSEQIILNVDIADTLSDLTGVPVPATEGESVASLLASGTEPVHTDFVFERLVDGSNPPSYCGVRSLTHKYVRYSTGEEELYDLVADPWEMQSLHADPRHKALKAELYARTVQLCNPPPPGYGF